MNLKQLLRNEEYSLEVKSLISTDGDGFSVDWKKYAEFRKKERLDNSATSLLIELGVLSGTSRGNYGLIGSGIELNPRYSCICTEYFTKKEDAIKFKAAECSGALYPVNIVQYLD